MTTTNIRQEAEELTTLLQEFNERYARTRLKRPKSPDASEEARLFSAYDAAEAALGRMLQLKMEPNAYRTAEAARNDPNPAEMAQDLGEISDRMESLLDNVNEHSDPESHTHIESALGRLQDASELLSGRALPKDNPAPYENQ